MNPYLEHSSLGTSVHIALINTISIALAPQLETDYYVVPEEKTYIIANPSNGHTFVGRPVVAVIQSSTQTTAVVETAASQRAGDINGYPYTVQVPISEEVKERYLEIRSTHQHEVITVIEILSPVNKSTGQGRVEYETKRQEVLHSQTNLIKIDLLRTSKPLDVFPTHDKYYYRILVSRA